MKPIDKKDMPKLVALIVVAIGLFGFAIYQFTAGASANAPKKPQEAAKVEATPAPAASPEPEILTAERLLAAAGVLGGRDPFEPIGKAAPKTGPLVIPAITGIAPIPGGAPNGWLKSVANALHPSPGAPEASGGTAQPNAGATVLPPPPPPSLTLTGVIVGDSDADSVAILHHGDERRFVSVGEAVGNGFVVASIHLDHIEIVDAKTDRRETVNLNH